MAPTLRSGKVCYLQIPSVDIAESAEFYSTVFGWRLRHRDDGTVAFDDTVNEVSGTWVTGRAPSDGTGVLVHVMVDDVAATLDAVVAAGGAVAEPVTGEAPEFVAQFRDPSGNVFGIGQQAAVDEEAVDEAPAATDIQPELWIEGAGSAVAFYQEAFGAEVLHLVGDGDDIVAQLSAGDARFWIAAADHGAGRLGPRTSGGATGRTLLVVADPAAVVARAVAAGAVQTAPVESAHGWCLGRLVDPFGHEWEIGRPLLAP
jgi:predicted enzyme related to lactoylglutathione lyase